MPFFASAGAIKDRLLHPIRTIIETYHPSAQEGANRRAAILGSYSKVPAVATGALIGAIGALTLPESAGAIAARAVAPAAENVLQTGVRLIGQSPFANIAEGNFASAAKQAAIGILGTGLVQETFNTIHALETGNVQDLQPSIYQSSVVLGAGLAPGAAHVAGIAGLIGRAVKSLTEQGVQKIEQGYTDVATAADEKAAAYRDFVSHHAKEAEQATLDALRAEKEKAIYAAKYIGGLPGEAYNAVAGLQFPSVPSINLPTQFGVEVRSPQLGEAAVLAALAAAAGVAYVHHRKKKRRYKKRHILQ